MQAVSFRHTLYACSGFLAAELLRADEFSEPAAPRVRTTLMRPGNGLNFEGMDSQVLRPMMTAFCLPGSAVLLVISLK